MWCGTVYTVHHCIVLYYSYCVHCTLLYCTALLVSVQYFTVYVLGLFRFTVIFHTFICLFVVFNISLLYFKAIILTLLIKMICGEKLSTLSKIISYLLLQMLGFHSRHCFNNFVIFLANVCYTMSK